MRKSRTPGSVRGVFGNGYPYRDIIDRSQEFSHLLFRKLFSAITLQVFLITCPEVGNCT